MINDKIPVLSELISITTYRHQIPPSGDMRYLTEIRGLDLNKEPVTTRHTNLFIQGVEELVRELRLKAAGPI